MNPCLPDWNIEPELHGPCQKKSLRQDHDLVELLWQNGQVVLNSQTHRKPGFDPGENRQPDETTIRASGSCAMIPENETVSWLNSPIDGSFEKEFCSNFLCEIPSSNFIETDKPFRQLEYDKRFKLNPSHVNHQFVPCSQHNCLSPNPLPPPRFPSFQSAHQPANPGNHTDTTNYQSQAKNEFQPSNQQFLANGRGEFKDCSVTTVASSHCGSNQVANDADASRVSTSGIDNRWLSAAAVNDYMRKVRPQSENCDRETFETAITSSSGGSGSSFGKTCNQSTGTNSHKRKGRDAEESESQSEAAEFESAAGDKPTQRSGTARRSRAAEVHNLSERKRRDRINEKMRALQELIPHSNKSDKASMLDEAIEYMKSLQLQLQMLWMGSGMASMMFPSVQQYISRMGMAMAPPTLPAMHNAMHLTRVPLVDQATSTTTIPQTPNQTSVLKGVNYHNQLKIPSFSDQYAAYMGFHPLQGASQPVNMFNFGSHAVQQNSMLAPSRHRNRHSIGYLL